MTGYFLDECWTEIAIKAFRIMRSISSLAFCLLIFGCASSGNNKDGNPLPKETSIQGPVRLELKLFSGRVEKTKFESVVVTTRTEKGKLINDRTETTDFIVKTIHVATGGPTGPFSYKIKTISKEGSAELHDLAFPELSETIDIKISAQADVLSAGNYPKESIFYVPSLSLPVNAVAVGETWTLQRRWYSLKGGLPMEFNIVSTFKNTFACGKSTCAEIEVQGVVTMPALGDTKKSLGQMKSVLRGRYLFDIGSGAVLWSDLRNTEHLVSGDWKIDVKSCLVGALDEPVAERWTWLKQVKCDPSQGVPPKVPGL